MINSENYENDIYEQNISVETKVHDNNPFLLDFFCTQQNSNINNTPLEEKEEGDKSYTLLSKFSSNSLPISKGRNDILNNINNIPFEEHNNLLEDNGYDIKNINININTNKNKNADQKKVNLNSIIKTPSQKLIIKKRQKKRISLFEVIYSPRFKELNSTQKRKIKNRYENKDNVLRAIKTRFFNNHIYGLLKKKLVGIGNRKNIEKFPTNFVRDINKNKKNKELWNMTLKEFLLWIETFSENEKKVNNNENRVNYDENIVNDLLVKRNEDFKILLDKKLCELYEDYKTSDEFIKKEIKRIQMKYNDGFYVKRFKDIAADFLNFFSIYK